MKDKINYKWLNFLIILIALYFLYLLRDFGKNIYDVIINILKPFIIGFVLAYAFYPFVKVLQKKRIPKFLSIIIVLVIIMLLFVFIVFSVIPIFTSQVSSFFNNLIKFLSNLDSVFDINLSSIKHSLLGWYNTFVDNIGDYISNGAISFVNTSIIFLSNFIISLVAFIYFLIDMDKIRMNIKFLLKNRSKKINKVVREIDNGMSNYFKGLLLCIIIQFVEYTVLFYLIGHPNFLLLGVLCSVSSIIPYFGGIIANVFAVITASVAGPKLLILTLLIAFICPNIDGYLISPNVYGKTNKLYPMISIFAVFAGSVLGGFVGILIALPIAIILQILYRSYRDEIKEKLEDIKN